MTNHILRVFHAVASAVSDRKSSTTIQPVNHHQPYDSVRALLEPQNHTVFDDLRGMSRQDALQARPR